MSGPPRKRLKSKTSKHAAPLFTKEQPPSGLFAPFRALGLVTNHVPFAMQVHSSKGAATPSRVNILTCVGRSWALWSGDSMRLLFVGSEAPAAITSVVFQGEDIWTASDSSVYKYIRGKIVSSIANPRGSALSQLMTFGSFLLALTFDGRHLLAWDTTSEELVCEITFDTGFTATHLLHPATYLNKILVGSSEGGLQLWNIRTQSCIYRFKPSSLHDSSSTKALGAVTAIVQSPAIDVVGIGFASGEITVYDVRADEKLIRMHMQGGSIRSMSFRGDGQPILATASSSGHIALWDLNLGGRLLHVVRGAHDGPVVSVEWVPGQALLVSSGEDNSVKQWFFDSPTAPPRLLKSRSGHCGPPHLIRYYGDDGKSILTASRDRSLRNTSVVRDSRSHELSQGSLAKKATSMSLSISSLKFPPITSLSYSTTRSKDWEDIVTTHANESLARTWHVQNKRCGRWTLQLSGESGESRVPPGVAKVTAVSACGNFGIVGSSTGLVQMWNLESGLPKRAYELPPPPVEVSDRSRGTESRAVTGLASDALNRSLIVATMDGTLNFFDFHSTELEAVVIMPSPVVTITLQRETGLLAVVCDDLFVRIVDIDTQRVVRELSGFKGRILDVTFSPDSRWLITTSLDSIIRTFDVPSGRLIDGFRTTSVASSVSFSPTGDFLATAHVDSVGVFLWANRAQYTEVSLRTVKESDIREVGMPTVHGLAEDENVEAIAALMVNKTTDVYATPEQLDEQLMTLTLLPRSKWQTLLNLEVIQQRNKPKEPPKPLESAPFFLPTLPGVEHRFDLSKPAADEEEGSSRILSKSVPSLETESVRKLASEDSEGDYEQFFRYIKTLSPAALDVEIRTLTGLEQLSLFINALIRRLHSHRDFEAVQSLIRVFFRIHGDVLVGNDELQEPLERLLETQKRESSRLLELISSSMGTLGFVRDTLA